MRERSYIHESVLRVDKVCKISRKIGASEKKLIVLLMLSTKSASLTICFYQSLSHTFSKFMNLIQTSCSCETSITYKQKYCKSKRIYFIIINTIIICTYHRKWVVGNHPFFSSQKLPSKISFFFKKIFLQYDFA